MKIHHDETGFFRYVYEEEKGVLDGLKEYMKEMGFEWIATMGIGTGCTVHLHDGELPMGRLVVSLSRHYTAVIDGVIRDTHDPRRGVPFVKNGVPGIMRRCVYGYWRKV